MNFEQFMDSKIPTWRTEISINVIQELKNMYEAAARWENTVNNIFDMALNHNESDIDYSTDLQKASDNLILYNTQLTDNINIIKQKINTENPTYQQESELKTK